MSEGRIRSIAFAAAATMGKTEIAAGLERDERIDSNWEGEKIPPGYSEKIPATSFSWHIQMRQRRIMHPVAINLMFRQLGDHGFWSELLNSIMCRFLFIYLTKMTHHAIPIPVAPDDRLLRPTKVGDGRRALVRHEEQPE